MRLVKPNLDVAIVASDAAATCAFYRDVLRFKLHESATIGAGATQHRFAFGRHLVKVYESKTPPAREPSGIERAIGMRMLALTLTGAELDAVVARLDAVGKRYSELAGADPAIRVVFVKDPEGNVIELIARRVPSAEPEYHTLQIGLTVADVQRSRHFYGEQLGLKEMPPLHFEGGGAVSVRYGFMWGETLLKFWSIPEALPVHTGNPSERAGIRTLTVMVEDLDEAHAELQARGIPIVKPPAESPGVARYLFIADPDGNWLEFAQRLR